MSETRPKHRTGRSIGTVLAGMLVGIVLSLGTDTDLHALHVFPPRGEPIIGYDGALLLATIYRTIYGVAGSYIIARLAPDQPMKHALAGGVIGLVVSILGIVLTWNIGSGLRAALVSARACRAGVAGCVGGRQTPRHTVPSRIAS